MLNELWKSKGRQMVDKFWVEIQKFGIVCDWKSWNRGGEFNGMVDAGGSCDFDEFSLL